MGCNTTDTSQDMRMINIEPDESTTGSIWVTGMENMLQTYRLYVVAAVLIGIHVAFYGVNSVGRLLMLNRWIIWLRCSMPKHMAVRSRVFALARSASSALPQQPRLKLSNWMNDSVGSQNFDQAEGGRQQLYSGLNLFRLVLSRLGSSFTRAIQC